MRIKLKTLLQSQEKFCWFFFRAITKLIIWGKKKKNFLLFATFCSINYNFMLMKIDFLSSFQIKLSSLLSHCLALLYSLGKDVGHNERSHYAMNLLLLLKWPIYNQHFLYSLINWVHKISTLLGLFMFNTWSNLFLLFHTASTCELLIINFLTYASWNSVSLNVLTVCAAIQSSLAQSFLIFAAFSFISFEFSSSIAWNM